MRDRATRHIYYFCSTTNTPYGGFKKIYQHVDTLNALGLSAFVVHAELNFRCDWFENKTPIAYMDVIEDPLVVIDSIDPFKCSFLPPFSTEDILVIPELMSFKVVPYASRLGLYTVIFNQGAYQTFLPLSVPKEPFWASTEGEEELPYLAEKNLGAIVVSEDSEEYLKFAFPGLEVFRVRNHVDASIFSYTEEKKKGIAFMPRRLPDDSKQVIYLLKERNRLKNWKFFPIEKMTESQVAQVLSECALFLSFSYQEGSGLPPQEAMLSGCVVVGYHGGGGKYFLQEPYAFPVAPSEIVQFAETVERVALEYEKNPAAFREQTRRALAFIRENYSQSHEKEDLREAWKAILHKHDAALGAHKH